MRTLFRSMAALFLIQCVTVPRGPVQRIHLDSKPTGASVKLTECGVGSTDRATTPATVFVNRRATRCMVTFSHPEYESRSLVLLRKGISTKEQDLAAVTDFVSEFQPGEELIVVALAPLAGMAWVIGRGVDALSGARYEQNRTRIIGETELGTELLSSVSSTGFSLPKHSREQVCTRSASSQRAEAPSPIAPNLHQRAKEKIIVACDEAVGSYCGVSFRCRLIQDFPRAPLC